MIPTTWDKSWNDFMNEEHISMLNDIEKKIGSNYFPEDKNVLRFLNFNLDNVKCVIVGMEPYPTSYFVDGKEIPVATGRSFEVSSINSWDEKFKQSSLRNILKTIYYNETNTLKSLDEIRTEIKNNEFKIAPPKNWFDNLENQGVLFLNATLTVKKETVDSHTKIWKDFIEELIKYIDKKNPKWLLWGNNAINRVSPLVNNTITCVHPRIASFVNENCFKEVKEIKWTGLKNL